MSCVYIYTDYTGYRLLTVLPRNAPDDMSKEFSETFRDARDFNKELQPYAENGNSAIFKMAEICEKTQDVA